MFMFGGEKLPTFNIFANLILTYEQVVTATTYITLY